MTFCRLQHELLFPEGGTKLKIAAGAGYIEWASPFAEFGFKDIRRCEMSKSEHEALNNVEGHFHLMPYDFCCLETMIVEGTK